ncbi:MAG: nucleotide exchange factor GrpE [Candidatus Methanoplasma sp.]|jgi:molecular chaperone GrpE|nr:nucleotide exchange factor GrpE [Candidatus Methanoplasma sp.]
MTGKSEKKAEEQKAALAAAEAKAEEYLDMARRAQADLENHRKRSQREAEEFRRYAKEGILRSLLAISDDLERALGGSRDAGELREGVENIRRNLNKVLEENGLSEIPADGAFDPAVHEALCVSDGDSDGQIAEVFQKGYRMHDRVIRFAKVRVTRRAEREEGPKEGEEPKESE